MNTYTCRKGHTGEPYVQPGSKNKGKHSCLVCKRARANAYNRTPKGARISYLNDLNRQLVEGLVLPIGTKAIFKPYKEPLQPNASGYGYSGTTGYNETGTHMMCNVCGYFFKDLAHHVRTHGMKAKDYKIAYQLSLSKGLISDELRFKLRRYALNRPTEAKEATLRQLKRNSNHRDGQPTWSTHKKSLEAKNKEGRCYYQLLDKIETLGKELGRTPTKEDFTRVHGKGIMGTIYDTFGTWNQALTFAGFTPTRYVVGRPRYSRESVILMIRNFYEIEGRVPRWTDLGGMLPSGNIIRKLFGGIIGAREAAGFAQADFVHETEE